MFLEGTLNEHGQFGLDLAHKQPEESSVLGLDDWRGPHSAFLKLESALQANLPA